MSVHPQFSTGWHYYGPNKPRQVLIGRAMDGLLVASLLATVAIALTLVVLVVDTLNISARPTVNRDSLLERLDTCACARPQDCNEEAC